MSDPHRVWFLVFLDKNLRVWYLPLSAVESNIVGRLGYGWNQLLVNQALFCGWFSFKFDSHVTRGILFMFEVQRMGLVAEVHERRFMWASA